MLYSETIWQEWCDRIEEDFKKKGYQHFDISFDFPSRKEELKKLISNPANISSYSFLPLIKIILRTPRFRYQDDEGELKLETKKRPISFASHFDTYIYSFYSFALNKIYQTHIHRENFDECVFAYRSDLGGKCNIQFAKEVFDYIKQKPTSVAIGLDITGYFDNIDHILLKEKWCKVLNINMLPPDQYKVFRSLTKYAYVNKSSFLKHFKINLKKEKKKKATLLDYIEGKRFKDKFLKIREENLIVTNSTCEILADKTKRYYGIPQGSSISALLSNIYLLDLDNKMNELAKNNDFLYRRYCDDIIIVCNPENAVKFEELLVLELEANHLKIQEKKLEKVLFNKDSKGNFRGFDLKKMEEKNILVLTNENEKSFYKSLQYLGFEYNGKNILIRPSSLSRYFRKMKSRITKTLLMTYGKKSKGDKIFKQQLFHRYTHLGKRNFLHYAYNSSKAFYKNSQGEIKIGMNSLAIKRQLKRHFTILIETIKQKSKRFK
jgi:RNA-directed DNA polymerase